MDGAATSVAITFEVELNVGGKLIYGASQKVGNPKKKVNTV